jgi:DNA invertase Pin-like site-specific DNA recombinase
MTSYVAYYRVSTDRQGASGLGLDAQREAVARFVGGAGNLLAEFTEVESGKKHTNRPQLAAALAASKKQGATLVIAKLDRLARNVCFVAGLLESGVDFICADMPAANKTMLQMLSVFGEWEREQISARTKAALAQAKRRGTKLGNPRLDQARENAAAANREIVPAATIAFIAKMRGQGETLRAIADQLNALNITTPRGSQWYANTVRAVLLQTPAALAIAA